MPERLTVWNGGISNSNNPIEKSEFAWTYYADGSRYLSFHCRGKPRRPLICKIQVKAGDPSFPTFGWDGSVESPTIKPSVGCDAHCGWHGHISNGTWEP